MYAMLAVHHTSAERIDTVRTAMQAIMDVIEDAPGLRGGYLGTNSACTEVFALTLWSDPEQFRSVLPAIEAEVKRSGIREWLVRPSTALSFVEAPHVG